MKGVYKMEKEKMKELSQEELKDVSGGLALNKAPAKDGLYPIGLAEDKLAGGLVTDKLAAERPDKLVEKDSLIKDLAPDDEDGRINPR